MMKAPANVTMIAGRRSTATIAPVSAPTERPMAVTARKPPATPSVPPIVVAEITAPRLTVAPMARLIPPVSISMAWAIETSASGNQFWVNLENPPSVKRPGNRKA